MNRAFELYAISLPHRRKHWYVDQMSNVNDRLSHTHMTHATSSSMTGNFHVATSKRTYNVELLHS